MILFGRVSVKAVGAFFGLLLSGCTFSAPQFESAIKLVRETAGADGSPAPTEPPVWFASVYGRGAVLRPYLSNKLIVFANSEGDAIAFDGWIVRSVVGFGSPYPLSISGREQTRTFMVADQQTTTNCEEWILRELVWTQACSNGPSEIVLDAEGNIQQITMTIGSGSATVTLRIAK